MGFGSFVDRLHKIGYKLKHSIRSARRSNGTSVQYLNNFEEDGSNTPNPSEEFFRQRNVMASTPSKKPNLQNNLLEKSDGKPSNIENAANNDKTEVLKPTPAKNDNARKPSNQENAATNNTNDYTVRVVVHAPVLIQSKMAETASLRTPKAVYLEPGRQTVAPRNPRTTQPSGTNISVLSQTQSPQASPKRLESTANKLKDTKNSVQNLNRIAAVPQKPETPEKFVVNLFESRPSKRFAKIKKKLPNVSKKGNNDIEIVPGGYKEFVKYKKQRDIECSKMAQASKLLEIIKGSVDRDWIDQLLVEKILLEAGERINLLNNKILELNYNQPGPVNNYFATVKLADFKFFLAPEDMSENYTDFYVLTALHGSSLVVSGFFTSVDFSVTFPEVFTFRDVNPDFEIKIKLFSIRLKTSGSKKKPSMRCPRSKLIFKDINTAELEERSVLKSSFKMCGEATITKKHIQEPLLLVNSISSNLKMNADFRIKLESLDVNANLSGFLNFGRMITNFVFWETKWCTLKGTKLSVYNEPDCSKSVIALDLRNGLGHTGRDEHCPKKRSFVINVGNDSDSASTSKQTGAYYFAANTNKDFKKWVHTINTILDSLNEWKY